MSDVKGMRIDGMRPLVPGERRNNPDGSYSTILNRSVMMPDGTIANVPSLYMGPQGPIEVPSSVSDDQLGFIASHIEQQQGTPFPRFKTFEEAVAAARAFSAAGGVK